MPKQKIFDLLSGMSSFKRKNRKLSPRIQAGQTASLLKWKTCGSVLHLSTVKSTQPSVLPYI